MLVAEQLRNLVVKDGDEIVLSLLKQAAINIWQATQEGVGFCLAFLRRGV